MSAACTPCDPRSVLEREWNNAVAGIKLAISSYLKARDAELSDWASDPIGMAMSVGPAGIARVGVGGAAARLTRWGWSGGPEYQRALRAVAGATDDATLGAKELGGILPTRQEAERLIAEAGGRIRRIERPHPGLGHKVPHINYVTRTHREATIQVQSVGRQWYEP